MRVTELEKEVEYKDKVISDLQTDMGALTAIVYAMKEKLGDDFKSIDDERINPEKREASSSRRVPYKRKRFDPARDGTYQPYSAAATDAAMERYYASEPSEARKRKAAELRAIHKDAANEKIMMIRQQNVDDERAQMLIQSLNPRRRRGNRSGIMMWGYHEGIPGWYIKRKNMEIEHYLSIQSFRSLTQVDLQELSNAEFYNPSRDKRGTDFYKFVREEAKKKFAGWGLPQSKLRKSKTDPDKKSVYWPATNQALQVPLGPIFAKGCLSDLVCWVYDSTLATVTVKTKTDEYILHTARDLLRFYEDDIKRLAGEQITISTKMVEEIPIFEEAAKVYTKMAKNIVDGGYWVGGKMADQSILLAEL